jgi:hypothetical protein
VIVSRFGTDMGGVGIPCHRFPEEMHTTAFAIHSAQTRIMMSGPP